MRFGPWYPLHLAAGSFPAGPGVLQVRLLRGLVGYPKGKSAMISYAGGEDLRLLVARLADAHPGAPWLCRVSEGPCPDPAAAAARMIAEFEERFGECPKIPGDEDMA